MLNEYQITTTQAQFLVTASTISRAITCAMRVEGCPESAILKVEKVRVVSAPANPL